MGEMMAYSPVEHRFRFAAWAAARAYGRGGKGLDVPQAMKALSDPAIKKLAEGLAALPGSRSDFDQKHHQWCEAVKASFGEPFFDGVEDKFYGRAAKLVNVYLKALFLQDFGRVSDGQSTQKELLARANFIHPPIDRILLNTLAKTDPDNAKFWRTFRDKGWTNFSEADYHKVIALVSEKTSGELWRIEEHWSGKSNTADP